MEQLDIAPSAVTANRRRLWKAGGLVVAMLLVGAVALGGWWYYGPQKHAAYKVRVSVPPAPSTQVPGLPEDENPGFQPFTPDAARTLNDAVPVSTAPIERAAPFRALVAANIGNAADILSRSAAVDCLTAAIYYEAAGESSQGQRAVAQVVLNRVRHPAYSHSVCGVVYQGSERVTGCQFSFTCDGSLARQPSAQGWRRARDIATAAIGGLVEPSVGTATHYHADYVVPNWASSLDKVTKIGVHIFYRWKGFWGRRCAFSAGYAGEANTSITPTTAVDSDFPAFGPVTTLTDPGDAIARPLADQGGTLLPPSTTKLPTATGNLHADADKGNLKVDEKSGVLIEARRTGSQPASLDRGPDRGNDPPAR